MPEVGGRRLAVTVSPEAPGLLVLNQNWAPGWHTLDGRAVIDSAGRLAAAVAPGDRQVVFVYTSPGLLAGAVVSALTLLGLIALPIVRRRRRTA